MRMLGFNPRMSPPNSSRLCEPSSASPSISPPVTRVCSAVSDHSRAAKAGSSIWKRSFTRTASPRFGFPGVVTSGNVLRKDTYLVLSDEVKRRGMVSIWSAIRVERLRSELGASGVRVGHAGRDAEFSGPGWVVAVVAVFEILFFDFGGMAIDSQRADMRDCTHVKGFRELPKVWER